MGLAPDDQRERDGIVEGGHAGKGEPSLAGPGKLQSERAQHDEEGKRGDPDAQGDDGQGWKLPERHGVEQEGPAPDDRQRDEKRPLPRAHDGLDAGRRNEIRFRIVHPCRFTPLHRIGDPFSAVRTGRTRCRPGLQTISSPLLVAEPCPHSCATARQGMPGQNLRSPRTVTRPRPPVAGLLHSTERP